MSETRMIAAPWMRLSPETAPPPNTIIELAKFPIQCGEQMPWLAIGMNLDGIALRDVFLGATHWRLAPQRSHELTVGVPADEISRLQSRLEELERALKPFADVADTWTVQNAAKRSALLTLSNGERMCAISANAFVEARSVLDAHKEGGKS